MGVWRLRGTGSGCVLFLAAAFTLAAPLNSSSRDAHARRIGSRDGGVNINDLLRKLWWHDEGQDIAEYAVMLAVILVVVVGTIRLVGSHANTVFSSAASSIQ